MIVEEFPPGQRGEPLRYGQFSASRQAEQKNQSHVLPRSLLVFDECESALNLMRPRRLGIDRSAVVGKSVQELRTKS